MATGGAGAAGGSKDDPQLCNEEDFEELLEKLRTQGMEQFDVDQLIVAMNKIIAKRDKVMKQLGEQHKKEGDDVARINKLLQKQVSLLKDLADNIVAQLQDLSRQGTELFDVDQLIVAVNKIVTERDELLTKQLGELKMEGDDVVPIKIKMLEDEVSLLKNLVELHSSCYQKAIMVMEMERAGESTESLQAKNSSLLREVKQKSDAIVKITAETKETDVLLNLERQNKELVKRKVEMQKWQLQGTHFVVRSLEERVEILENYLETVKQEAELLRVSEEEKDMGATAAEPNVMTQAQIQEELLAIASSQQDMLLMKEIQELVMSDMCTSCQIKPKNAVLIKCSHMFCYDCLRKRYKKKKRTCPTCNMPFAGSDYHRINIDDIN